MKNFFKKFCIIIIGIFILSFVLPFEIPVVNNMKSAEAATIKMNKSKIEINVGETYKLKISGTKLKVKWSTSNKKYATVSDDGLVSGVKSGTSIITAIIEGKKYNCRVMVKYPTLNKVTIKACIGETFEIKVKNFPLTLNKSDISYKVDNEGVVKVDENGLMTAISDGYANIYVTFGSYKLYCLVEVSFTDRNKEDAINAIKVEYSEINNQIVCVVENNSNIDLTMGYDLAFYDVSNNLVSVSGTPGIKMGFFKGDSAVVYFEKPQKEYSYYKIRFFDLWARYYYLNMKDKVDVTASDPYDYTYEYREILSGLPIYMTDTIKVIDLNVNNRSGNRVMFNAYIVYYKDNRIININHFDNMNGDIDVGSSILKNPIVNDYLMNKLIVPEYDDYKLLYTAKLLK